MACDAPIRECLAWHIQPRIDGPVIPNGRGIRARCPACGKARGFTIGPGDRIRIMWNCYRCEDQAAIRQALTEAGVPSGCLPRIRDSDAEMIAAAIAVLHEGTDSRARLRAYLILTGRRSWPRGAELERLAAEVGVSRTRAFAARQAGGLHPGTSVPKGRRA
jgi:hypothetical protein